MESGKSKANKAQESGSKDEFGKLAAKLAKAETDADALKILEKAGDPDALLEKLARSGKLTIAGAGQSVLLANWAHHLPADAIVAWLAGLTDVADEYWGSLPGLAWPVYNTVRASYRKEPDVWRAALGGFSGRKRDAVLLAMGRWGDPIPEADRARMLEELVPHAFSGVAEQPTEVAMALGVTGRAWGERTLPGFSKSPDADPWEFVDAVALSPYSLTEKLVLGGRPCRWNTEKLVMGLLGRRDDAPEVLVGLAQKLLADPRTDDKHERDKLVEAMGALALERAHGAGKEAPPGTEALLNGSHYEHAWRNERVVAFAGALPPARLHAYLGAQMEDFSFQLVEYGKSNGNGHLSAGLLRVAFDEALARRWLARTCESIRRSNEAEKREAISLGQAGPVVLPLVLGELGDLPRGDEHKKLRAGLRLTVLVIAAELAQRDQPIPPGLDELVSGDEELRSVAESFADAKTLGPVLAKLPPERGERVVRSWLALESAYVNKQLARMAPPHLRSLVVEETPAERVARLAKATGLACDTRIYALLPVSSDIDDEDEIEALAGVVNRAGAAPKGLSADRIPKVKNKPMKHVLTFDLDALPEVRARMNAGDARAVALFVSPQKNNSSGEPFNDDMVYVPLSKQEALSGPGGDGGRAFTIVPIDVPAAAFTGVEGPGLSDLRRAILVLPGRALGRPNLIQDGGEESLDHLVDEFLMQVDEGIVPMNLGDQGLLYLYRSTAFWQCH